MATSRFILGGRIGYKPGEFENCGGRFQDPWRILHLEAAFVQNGPTKVKTADLRRLAGERLAYNP